MSESKQEQQSGNKWGRRKFVTTLITASGIVPILFNPSEVMAKSPNHTINGKPFTVQQIIDLILQSIPSAPFPQTVDTIKAGTGDQVVSGIATTMFATNAVIEKAAALGVNFIIAHEPTFYNHADDTTWLQNDEVYQHKLALLKKRKMAVWRFHDYIHGHKADGILMGVFTALGWERFYNANKPLFITIPSTPLKSVIELSKKKLGIPHVKFIGNPAQSIQTVALIPGAAGGRMQIEAIRDDKPDLLMCGELNEWETSEYVRDLQFMGGKASLLVLGHIVSEEPGLEWLVKWLQPQVPDIKITHIPSGDAFSWA